jgi:hypothetical protein
VHENIGRPGCRLLESSACQFLLDLCSNTFVEEPVVVEARIARREVVGRAGDSLRA